MAEDNGRTHEPSLRELTGDLDALRGLFGEAVKRLEDVGAERDRRYEDRFKASESAVAAAFAAYKEQVKTAFDSAEKAITKAETAQTVYNQGHNDVQKQRMEAEQNFARRPDVDKGFLRADERIDDLKKGFETYQTLQAAEIRSLRESRSALSGAWMAMIAVAALVGSVGGFLLHALAGK